MDAAGARVLAERLAEAALLRAADAPAPHEPDGRDTEEASGEQGAADEGT
jgi:hypothetical protein